MADQNLVIGVRADASQLRADLAVAQAQVRAFGSELRAAATQSLATGNTSPVAALAGQLDAAVTRAKALRAEIVANSAEALTFSQRLKEGGQGLEQLASQFRGGLGGLLGGGGVSGAALGIAAVAAAIGEVVHLATSAAEHAHEITAFAAAIGVSTGQVREWTHAAAEAGVNEELFTKTIERQTIAAEKAADALRKNAIEAAKITAADATGGALRGGANSPAPPPSSQLIDVGAALVKDTAKLREFAQQQYADFQKIQELQAKAGQIPTPLVSFETFLAKLRQDMAQTTPEAAKLREEFAKMGGDAPIKSLAEGLGRLAPDFKDAFGKIGVDVLGVNGKLRDMGAILDDISAAFKRVSEAEALAFQRATGGRGAIDPNLVSFMKQGGPAGGFNTPPSQDASVKAGEEAWKAQIKAVEQLKEAAFQAGLGIDKAAMSMAEHIGDATKDTDDLDIELSKIDAVRFDNITAALKGLADLAKSVADSIANAFKAGAGLPGDFSGGGAPALGGGFAAGGLIRGPGSGTSDSILARLSDGEYVVHAAATKANLGLLHAINNGFNAPRFALGGLVAALSNIMPPPPAFASGGLVDFGWAGTGGSAGVGGTLHLHFGHETFAIRTDAHTLGQVTRAARQAQLLSAGRKPGWVGG